MIRKLFIVFSLICALTLVSGCSDSKEKEPTPKEPIKKEQIQKTPKKENIRKLSDDEVCELICGYYVNKSYLDHFEATKSATASQKLGEMLAIRKDETSGQYSLMHGDLHQGNDECALTEIKYIEETNEYYIYFEPYYDSDETLLIYNADADTFSYRGYGQMKLTEDEFMKFDTYDDHRSYLAYLVLKDSPDVTIKDQKVYALTDSAKPLIKIQSDAMFDFPESTEMMEKGLCGYALISRSEDEVEENHFYFIEDDLFTIRDEEDNIILELKIK